MLVEKLIITFKVIEPIFWIAQSWIFINLIDSRVAFDCNLKVINKFLSWQGFSTQLYFEDKAFKRWHRDLRILMFLNPLVIILIHLI